MARQNHTHTLMSVPMYMHNHSVKKCTYNLCHACAVRMVDCAGKGAMADILARQAGQKHNLQ